MLSKPIEIVGKEFGYYTYDKNNTAHFHSLGTVPDLREVFVGLENRHITLKLSHEFL